ncbi:MAG: C45 family autoproteolytic acyltransferase/hydrolase [Candidatus Cyclobacteriaceae bacterium M2_1C_046]
MKIFKYSLALLLGLFLLLAVIFFFKIRLNEPSLPDNQTSAYTIENTADGLYRYGPNWLRKNDKGTWEMYLEGNSYQQGNAIGVMGKGLMLEKEEAFIDEIKNRIPSESYLGFLKYVVGWMNRDLDQYVPEEQLQEIYASSQYMDNAYDFVAPKYHRALNYHAAHDIGHAMQNMNLVGCTSFAVWGDRSVGNKLLIGRNFDFYFGQEFAKDKIIAFYNPEKGYKFMSVTWAGFTGVVSGMNEEGLTITLNSAKSGIPTKGKTPVSVIARQILQYASTIEEAYEIAKSYDSFVAETFLIGSKKDGKAGLIEKSPEKTALFLPDDNDMVVTNHFQSKELFDDENNQEYLQEGVSDYRYKRVEELIEKDTSLDIQRFASILRDKKGIDNKNIGLNNEKAINQLIAHHSVIFSPEDMIMWVSTSDYGLGEYLAYDLKKVFSEENNGEYNAYTDSLNISEDPFLYTEDFKKYTYFATMRDRLQHFLFSGKGGDLSTEEVNKFVDSNPNGYLTYYYLGNYFVTQENWTEAKKYLEIGLTKEIAKESEKHHMQAALQQSLDELRK